MRLFVRCEAAVATRHERLNTLIHSAGAVTVASPLDRRFIRAVKETQRNC